MKILVFQERLDPEAYLKWEWKVEIIFEYHTYIKEQKAKLTVIEFTN